MLIFTTDNNTLNAFSLTYDTFTTFTETVMSFVYSFMTTHYYNFVGLRKVWKCPTEYYSP